MNAPILYMVSAWISPDGGHCGGTRAVVPGAEMAPPAAPGHDSACPSTWCCIRRGVN